MELLWIAILFIALFYWLVFRRQRLTMPGPKGWPLVGSIFQIDPGRSHLTLTEWAKKYGSVYSIKFVRNQVVVVNSLETIRDVLVKRGDVFAGRPVAFRSVYISQLQDVLNSSSNLPHWHSLRKVTHKYVKLLSAGTEALESKVYETVEMSMDRIATYNGKPFSIYDELQTFSLAIIFFLVFGEVADEESAEFEMIKEAQRKFGPDRSFLGKGLLLDQFPLIRLLPNETFQSLKDAVNILKTVFDVQKKKIKIAEDGTVESVFQAMDQMQKKFKYDNNAPVFNDTNFRTVMQNLLVAGIGTTTAALHAFINLLLNYPEIKSKLQYEVESVLGKTRRVKITDRENMPYTRAAILELLRYTTIVPLAVPHSTLKDTDINGHFIPKDTMVLVNLWHLHHDEKFWGDPWAYRPERYLDNAGNLVLPDHPYRRHLFAFGAGNRTCVGEVFALNRIFLYIVTLLQRFDLQPAQTGILPPSDPRLYAPEVIIRPEDFKQRLIPN